MPVPSLSLLSPHQALHSMVLGTDRSHHIHKLLLLLLNMSNSHIHCCRRPALQCRHGWPIVAAAAAAAAADAAAHLSRRVMPVQGPYCVARSKARSSRSSALMSSAGRAVTPQDDTVDASGYCRCASLLELRSSRSSALMSSAPQHEEHRTQMQCR